MLGLSHILNLRRAPLAFYDDAHRRHGDHVRFRMGPYRLWLLFHPREIEAVLTDRATDFVRFERVMRVLAQWNGDSLLIREGEAWRSRRRQILPSFARRRMARFAESSVAMTVRLADVWLARAGDARAVLVDADAEMARLALDIALDAMFGAQAQAGRDDIAQAVAVFSDVAYAETSGLGRMPRWSPFGRGPAKRRAIATMDAFVRRLIAERLRNEAVVHDDLLSALLEGDKQAARDDAVTMLIAGHETSGAALCWLGLLLAQTPPALAAATAEVDAVLQGREATLADFAALTFLRAAVEEALRLYPPAYGLFPRRALRDVLAGEVSIRRGDLVMLTPWVVHRDPRWFDAPEAFRPERFLTTPTWPAYAYFPFGAGPRSCIGQQFGLVEITLAMATLLQRFTPERAEAPAKPQAKFSLRPEGGARHHWALRAAR